MATAKPASADLAIVMGGEPPMEEDDYAEEDEFSELAAEVFPDKDPSLIKAMIQACIRADAGEGL